MYSQQKGWLVKKADIIDTNGAVITSSDDRYGPMHRDNF